MQRLVLNSINAMPRHLSLLNPRINKYETGAVFWKGGRQFQKQVSFNVMHDNNKKY